MSNYQDNVNIVYKACKQYGLNDHNTQEVMKIVQQESHFDSEAGSRTSTAKGLGQFTDSTWIAYGRGKDVLDPVANADATVRMYIDARGKAAIYYQDDIDAGAYKFYHDGLYSVNKNYGGYSIYNNLIKDITPPTPS
jgi:hypothetical protein